ncbi:MAG: hypothetical protein IPI02_06475 [Sterolibacteriaceae bacterium]|nr:hypothetical protein [Sterolibacteriaceae bacterium]
MAADRGGLSKLGRIELVVVNGDKALSRQWRAMMQRTTGDGPLWRSSAI